MHEKMMKFILAIFIVSTVIAAIFWIIVFATIYFKLFFIGLNGF